MVQTTSIKVPFSISNVNKCVCPKCPVQKKSQCSSGKMSRINDSLKASPLRREDIPEVYCATGIAACTDIDVKQSCICGNCPVFSQYKLIGLTPVMYYCRDGSVK